ncbi:MAG TPA: hypothetical protein VMD56_08645 [Steroidobacteraceae bacterium]|nr:hypothetical protein [Steroidobacteraceae bacterium]
MRRATLYRITGAVVGAAALISGAAYARISNNPLNTLATGDAHLMSAGPLAFGPDGILFVGDSIGGQVMAIDTHDRRPASAAKVDVQDINAKIAAMVGITPDQLVINDVKVNPISKNVYLSVSRGRGPDAMPLIVRVERGSDRISVLPLDDVAHAAVQLSDAPASASAADPPNGRPSSRMLTITDMVYVKGDLMVAGLSNEEWSSALRSIPFPFQRTAAQGATIQIWHSSHGRFETQAPIRTFVPYDIDGRNYVLAAYTCTPLVKIPFSELHPGARIHGTEIADLGAGNQPLDMVPYRRNGHDYILINNTSRGVMKLQADDLGAYKPISAPTITNVAGVPYQTISDLQNVRHLARLDAQDVLILTGKSSGPPWQAGPLIGPVNLQTIPLP